MRARRRRRRQRQTPPDRRLGGRPAGARHAAPVAAGRNRPAWDCRTRRQMHRRRRWRRRLGRPRAGGSATPRPGNRGPWPAPAAAAAPAAAPPWHPRPAARAPATPPCCQRGAYPRPPPTPQPRWAPQRGTRPWPPARRAARPPVGSLPPRCCRRCRCHCRWHMAPRPLAQGRRPVAPRAAGCHPAAGQAAAPPVPGRGRR
ncbi:MAG: hypothetical protein J3K34DRAFT_442603 [Monoraphidium minutum]|nr:MAG: hypothetical protein J3K34DRAFT_442603 [Monoraphidium minutum]